MRERDDQDKLAGKDLDNLVDDHISDEIYIKMLQRWKRDIYILANICHKDSASIQMIIEIYFSLLTPSFSNPYIIQQLFTSTLLDAFYILTPFYKPEVMHKLFLEKKININGINMNSTSTYIPPSLSTTPPSSIPRSLSNLQYNSQHHLMKQNSNSSYHENNDCVSSLILDSSISNSATPPPISYNILINSNKLYIDTTTTNNNNNNNNNNNIHSFSHSLSGSNRNSLDPLEYDSEIYFPKASITPIPSSTSISPYEVNNSNEIVFDGDRNEIYTTTTQGNSSSFSEVCPLNMDTIYKEADNDIEISPLSNSTSPIPLKRINTNQINSTFQSSDLNTCIDYTYDIHNNKSANNILLTPTNKDRIAISHHNNIIT
ncbi:hypothetical protein WA158_006002 [Blastocystis sp. Blastoise]